MFELYGFMIFAIIGYIINTRAKNFNRSMFGFFILLPAFLGLVESIIIQIIKLLS